jgi:serine phosphatase RsbU (regulator of sigma subunit)
MKAAEWFRRAERYVRSSTEGFHGSEFRRLFDRDAVRAYDLVTREHDRDEEPASRFWRFLYRARILFLGLSYRLSPPRRVVFVLCIVFALWGMTDRVVPLSLVSVAGLVFLLVLELADRIVVRDELEVARDLQRELLPRQQPGVEGYEFAFSYRTANTIGGDYYDFLPLDDGRLAIVIGDASGHGIAAGLVMAIANSALKLGFDHDSEPLPVTRLVNRALCRTGGRRAFMTLFCGVLDPSSGRLDYVCAGHPYPLLRRASGEILELGTGALPLGIRLNLEMAAECAVIEPGDVLLLFTDGVFETLDGAGDSFGFERLRAALSPGGSSRSVHDRVLQQVDEFRGDEPLYDDCSVVVVSREPARGM